MEPSPFSSLSRTFRTPFADFRPSTSRNPWSKHGLLYFIVFYCENSLLAIWLAHHGHWCNTEKTVQFGARNVPVYISTQSSHGDNGEVASKQRKEKQLALETNPTYHPKRPFAYSFRNHFFMVSFATAFSKLSRLRFCLSRGLCQDNCITKTLHGGSWRSSIELARICEKYIHSPLFGANLCCAVQNGFFRRTHHVQTLECLNTQFGHRRTFLKW